MSEEARKWGNPLDETIKRKSPHATAGVAQ
jgi:hypothetical protein